MKNRHVVFIELGYFWLVLISLQFLQGSSGFLLPSGVNFSDMQVNGSEIRSPLVGPEAQWAVDPGDRIIIVIFINDWDNGSK